MSVHNGQVLKVTHHAHGVGSFDVSRMCTPLQVSVCAIRPAAGLHGEGSRRSAGQDQIVGDESTEPAAPALRSTDHNQDLKRPMIASRNTQQKRNETTRRACQEHNASSGVSTCATGKNRPAHLRQHCVHDISWRLRGSAEPNHDIEDDIVGE